MRQLLNHPTLNAVKKAVFWRESRAAKARFSLVAMTPERLMVDHQIQFPLRVIAMPARIKLKDNIVCKLIASAKYSPLQITPNRGTR